MGLFLGFEAVVLFVSIMLFGMVVGSVLGFLALSIFELGTAGSGLLWVYPILLCGVLYPGVVGGMAEEDVLVGNLETIEEIIIRPITHKIALRPTPEQADYFKRACGTARKVLQPFAHLEKAWRRFSGISIHRHPVTRTYRIPFSVFRSSARGLPVQAFGGSRGLMKAHCSSFSSRNSMLHPPSQPRNSGIILTRQEF